ncbi:MAG: helix-hairpin-helix domain-containing protein [Planctomycetes bacterium]|nr:helix-hairpin-helix domain-containing protein [Planctomycetota bacterium]
MKAGREASSSERAEVALPSGEESCAEPRVDASPERSSFWLRRGDQLVLGCVLCVAIALAAAHWARLSGWGLRPIEIEQLPERRLAYRLDINEATWVEWLQLPGVGEVLARRIVEDRQQRGPFATIDSLSRVRGVGPKTVERLRPWLTVRSH